jgi:lipopolysaccharide export system permease protein
MKFKFPEITIFDRYMFKQVALASLVAILLFTIVWIAPEILLNTIKGALNGDYTFKTALLLLWCEIPKILDKAFPVGLLLGTLFTFDKMSKSSEITIFRAVGMSFSRIIAPVIVLSCIFTCLCFFVGDKGTPMSEHKKWEIKGMTRVTQYIYTQKDKTGHPLMAVIVSKSNDRELKDVMVLDFSSQVYQDVHQLSNIYAAKSGYANDDYWDLKDISTYKISPDGIFVDVGHLDRLKILEGQSAKIAYTLMLYSTMKNRDISNADLKTYVGLLKKEGLMDEYNGILNKYLQRYTHPLVCILLAILGCLLGFSKPREQRLIGFTIAIGFIFGYYITLPFFDLLAEKEILSPYITSTFPIMAFTIAIFAFYKSKDL